MAKNERHIKQMSFGNVDLAITIFDVVVQTVKVCRICQSS